MPLWCHTCLISLGQLLSSQAACSKRKINKHTDRRSTGGVAWRSIKYHLSINRKCPSLLLENLFLKIGCVQKRKGSKSRPNCFTKKKVLNGINLTSEATDDPFKCDLTRWPGLEGDGSVVTQPADDVSVTLLIPCWRASTFIQAEDQPQAAPAPTCTLQPQFTQAKHTESPLCTFVILRQLHPRLVTQGLQQVSVVHLLHLSRGGGGGGGGKPGRFGIRRRLFLRLQEGV